MKQPAKYQYKGGIYDSMNIYRAIADLKNFRKDYKDPLSLLLNLTLEPLQFKIVILVITYATSQWSFALCLTIYRLLSTFDEKILLKHGSVGGVEIFVLVNLWTVVLKYKEIMWFAEVFKTIGFPLTESIIGEKKYKEIRLMIFVLKIVVMVILVLSLSAALGFTSSPEYFNAKAYIAVWIKENFPHYAEYILFCVHLSNFPVALVLSSLAITVPYFGYSSVLYLIFINKLVESICESKIAEDRRYSSEIFQNSVKTKLKIVIMMHSTAAKLCVKGVDMMYIPLFAFFLAGVILGCALLLEFFTNDSSEISNQYFGLVCFAAAGSISSALYVSSGQHLKNESERTLSLLNQLPWYYMNEENLQIYRIFSLMAGKPLSISTNILEVNYFLLVRIFKAIYSIAALIAQFATSTVATSQ